MVEVPVKMRDRVPCVPTTATIPTPWLLLTLMMSHGGSLEEINKERIALGLKPLIDDGALEDSPEKQAEDNYAKQRQKEAQEREKKYVYLPLNPLASLTCGLSGGSRMG